MAAFSLDLTTPVFMQTMNWRIVINNVVTNANAGAVFTYEKKPVEAVGGGLRKVNGFCGGMMDVVNAPFCFAYTTGKDAEAMRLRAREAHRALQGAGFWRISGNFGVVADTNLTAEFCAGRNVILFASPASPGAWLERHAAALPFAFSNGVVRLDGQTNSDMQCVYPNPVATNRYLLTVCGTQWDGRLLRVVPFDVLMGERVGSFDAAWRRVEWEGSDEEGHGRESTTAAGSGTEPREEGVGIGGFIGRHQKAVGWTCVLLWVVGVGVWGASAVGKRRRQQRTP